MTTQYTPILKLALPVQGELSGTWGDVVNDNITSMVEQAIAGLSVVNTWTTNSHTLTTANGTTAESRAAMLSLTDSGTALTGAGSVICPALSKVYIVKNGTAQVITVKTAAGSGIAVPVGKTMLVYCDGTNVLEAVDHVVTLSAGTLTITGLTTFASLKGTGAVTVTNILDEDNMASDSATALATQQSIKAYVDSQVGAFDTLAEVLANGNTTGGTDLAVSTGDDITFADSSKAIFGAGSDLEIYHDGTNNRLTFASANTYIQTDGTIHFTDIGNSEKHFTINDNGAVDLYYDNVKKLATTATGIDVTGTLTADGMVITSSGTARLDFAGGSGEKIRLRYSSNEFVIGTNDLQNIYAGYQGHIFQTGSFGGTERMRIDASGNVGIGTSTSVTLKSATTLQVSGNAKLGDDNGRGLLSLGDIASTGANAGIWRGAAGAYAGTGNYLNLGGYDGITFTTGAADISAQTERMRIDASGNLLVGTTSTIPYTFSSGTGAGITSSGTVMAGATAEAGLFNRIGSDGGIVNFYKAGTTVGSIGAANGNLYLGQGDTTIMFSASADAVLPKGTDGADRDGFINLGQNINQFKDLYLSGIAYATYVGSSGDTDTSIAFDTANTIRFTTGGSEATRLDASGNLLVGTSVSGFGLAVYKANTDGINSFSGAGCWNR
jgi:hypothetical protein